MIIHSRPARPRNLLYWILGKRTHTLPGSSTNWVPPTEFTFSIIHINNLYISLYTLCNAKVKGRSPRVTRMLPSSTTTYCRTAAMQDHVPRWQSRYLQSLTNHENSLHNSKKLLRHFTIPEDTAYSIRRLTVPSIQVEESGDKASVKSRLWSTETLQPPTVILLWHCQSPVLAHQLLSDIPHAKGVTLIFPGSRKTFVGKASQTCCSVPS